MPKAKAATKKPSSKPVSTRGKRDNVDPNLIIEGTRSRKQTTRARDGSDQESENEPKQTGAACKPRKVTAALSPIQEADEDEFDLYTSRPDSFNSEDFIDEISAVPSDPSSSEEKCLPKKTNKPTKTGKKISGKSIEEDEKFEKMKHEISFEIPRQSSGIIVHEITRVSILKNFEEVRTLMHQQMECADVHPAHYPQVMLHFSKDPAKKKRPFETAQHWIEARTEWILELEKKKLAARVTVDVPDTFWRNLEQSNKMKAARSKDDPTVSKSGRAAKAAKRAQFVDIYASDNSKNGSGGSDNENSADHVILNELEASLQDCNRCNANKNPSDRIPCLINKNGVHKRISLEMIRAWVFALMKNEAGVDLKIPPKRDPFLEFHYYIPGASVGPEIGLPAGPVLKKRRDRQEVLQVDTDRPSRAQSLPPVPTNYSNPPLCFMPMSREIIKYMFNGSSPPKSSNKVSSESSGEKHRKRTRAQSSDEYDSESSNGAEYPTVQAWLATLEKAKGVDNYDVKHFHVLFERGGCLSTTIDTLTELGDLSWGESGLGFNFGEIAWLKKNIRKSMEKLEHQYKKEMKKRKV